MSQLNKDIVLRFFDLTFNKHQPRLAAKCYIGERYIQHNPHTADGIDAFCNTFERFFQHYPLSFVLVKRVIAENDLVVLHVLAKKHPDDSGEAVAEFFRLNDGKIVEHWDVTSPIPVHSNNNNEMV
jgi:predicted SnoaL-like aldol condensation-catalyzing enzyme